MKKAFSVILSVLLTLSCLVPAVAVGAPRIENAHNRLMRFEQTRHDNEDGTYYYTYEKHTADLHWELYEDGALYLRGVSELGHVEPYEKDGTRYGADQYLFDASNYLSAYTEFGDGNVCLYQVNRWNDELQTIEEGYIYYLKNDEGSFTRTFLPYGPEEYAALNGVTFESYTLGRWWEDAVRDYRENGHADFQLTDVYFDGVSITHGKLGDNLTWQLQGDTLTVTGSGDMYDFQNPNNETLPASPFRYYATYGRVFFDQLRDPRFSDDNWNNRHGIVVLRHVILPEGMTSIGAGAFTPDSLFFYWPDSVSIPSTVTRIGDYAFVEWLNLRSVDLPAGLREIGDSAFAATRLKSVTIPAGVRSVGHHAFATVRCETIIPSTLLYSDPIYIPFMTKLTVENDALTLPEDLLELSIKPITSDVIRTEETLNDVCDVYRTVSLLEIYYDALRDYSDHLDSLLPLNSDLEFSVHYGYDPQTDGDLRTFGDVLALGERRLADLNRILGTNFASLDDLSVWENEEEDGHDDRRWVGFSEAFYAAFRERFGVLPNEIFRLTQDGETPKLPWITVNGHKGTSTETFANSIGATFVCTHGDRNGDGFCDYCGTQTGEPTGPVTPSEPEKPDTPAGDTCSYCGRVHTGAFGGLIKFIHSILYFFAHLFGKK